MGILYIVVCAVWWWRKGLVVRCMNKVATWSSTGQQETDAAVQSESRKTLSTDLEVATSNKEVVELSVGDSVNEQIA